MVIGAGIACTAAIMRRLAGYEVVILEKARSNDPKIYPICTETSAIVSENHSGAEYPYDPQSTMDCLDGRIANEHFFPDFIYAGKTYTRILASASMIAIGDDIRDRCRKSLEVITERYRERVAESESNYVFGDPETICHEQECAMIYHPPAAHIEVALMSPASGTLPASFLHMLDNGHPEIEQRTQQTLHALQAFYPELKYAEILDSYLKVAINTTDISRRRRSMPVFQVTSRCNMIVLPKWTMAVMSARKDLEFALACSIQRGTCSKIYKETILQQAIDYALPVPTQWKTDFSAFLKIALQHARNMRLPESIISPMDINNIQSLAV